MNYIEKYNKYNNKIRYLQYGGGYFYDINDIYIKRRNAKPDRIYRLIRFKNIYLKATLNNLEVDDRLMERRRAVVNNRPRNDFHITLLHLELNLDHPDANKLFHNNRITPEFETLLSDVYDAFVECFRNIELRHIRGPLGYEMLGEYNDIKFRNKKSKKFLTKKFEMYNRNTDEPDTDAITCFRTVFYDGIDRIIGKIPQKTEDTVNNKLYHLREYPIGIDPIGDTEYQPLFAVRDFYYGKGVLTPHISIFDLDEVREHNTYIYHHYKETFERTGNDEESMMILLENILSGRFRGIPVINVTTDMYFSMDY